jgi:hypothetical protein
MKKSSGFEWHRQFKEGWEDVRDDSRSGQANTQSTDANKDREWTLVGSDRRLGAIWKCWQGYGTLEKKTQTLTWQVILHHDNAPVQDVLTKCEFLAKKSVTKMDHPSHSYDLAPCDFRLFLKLKKCPEGTKIWWHSWHPMQCDVTARYPGKRFSRQFPAVAPSSHKVHSFTRGVVRRRQQLLGQR